MAPTTSLSSQGWHSGRYTPTHSRCSGNVYSRHSLLQLRSRPHQDHALALAGLLSSRCSLRVAQGEAQPGQAIP